MTESKLSLRLEKDKTICVAVLGTGNMGMRHLQTLSQIPGCRTVAVPKRSHRVAELERSGYDTAENLGKAAQKGAILAIIATDTGSHGADGRETLEHGLDLLIEKPLAADRLEAGHLLDCARKHGRRIFVGCVLRFSQSLNVFRESLVKVGRLHSVQIQCQSYLPDWRTHRHFLETYSARAVEGGVLLDLVHEVDYAGWLFGWPSSVKARLRNLGRLGIAAEELAELRWETPEGCLVSVSLDYLTRPPRRQMRAFGERGTLVWDGISGSVTFMQCNVPAEDTESSQTRDEMFAAQSRAFVTGGCGQHDFRLATGEEGYNALAVCDAARRSSLRKCEEMVKYR
jgi:predicted dehydrogenase